MTISILRILKGLGIFIGVGSWSCLDFIVSTMQFTDINLPIGTNSGCCVSHSRIKGADKFGCEIYVDMIKISVVR